MVVCHLILTKDFLEVIKKFKLNENDLSSFNSQSEALSSLSIENQEKTKSLTLSNEISLSNKTSESYDKNAFNNNDESEINNFYN